MEAVIQDIRYGARMLRVRPSFTLVAALSLGLGIGANTTIFTIVNAVFGSTVPVAEPERLVRVHTIDWEDPDALTGVSLLNYEDYRDQSTTFGDMAAYVNTSMNLLPPSGEARQIAAQLVTANYFELLGVRAGLGRTFLADEDERPTPVVVLSHGMWDRQFGADPTVVGGEVNLGGRPYVVVGVTEPGFKGLQALASPDRLWIPMEMSELALTGILGQFHAERRARFNQVIGRLRDGATLQQAREEIRAIAERLEQEYPVANTGRTGDVRLFSALSERQREQYARAGGLMMSVVGVVLLIACANVANLLLARAADREREIALRIALGARRLRLVRQLLTESLLLAALGGAFGIVLAFWGRDLLWAYRPPNFGAQSIDLALDGSVLAFTLLVTFATGVTFGLVPALQASSPDLKTALQEGGGRSASGSNRAWLRGGLVVAEVALALVALIGAGLFVRSLRNAQGIDPGFETDRLAVMRLNLGNAGYSQAEGFAFYRAVVERVRAVPGVASVSLQSGGLLGGGLPHTTFPQGGIDLPEGRGLHTHEIHVTPEYFDTVGIGLLRGRRLTELDDAASAPVAVVNEATLRLLWPEVDNPIGLRFTRSIDPRTFEIVGVVQDALIDIARPPQPAIYTPLLQNYQSAMQLQVLTERDPDESLLAVLRAIRELDPSLPVLGAGAIADDLDRALWAPRMGMALLGIFGGLALVLAMIGIYGVMAYTVSQRHHEIGIRMALGAERGQVVTLVLAQGLRLVGAGVGVGVILALGTTRWIQSMLWGVSAADPLTFAIVIGLLGAVALVANLLPARRVTRVDPVIAMRTEH